MSEPAFKPGDPVWYFTGHCGFAAVVATEPWQLGHGVWVVHLSGLGPDYGEYTGRRGATRVAGAACDELLRRTELTPEDVDQLRRDLEHEQKESREAHLAIGVFRKQRDEAVDALAVAMKERDEAKSYLAASPLAAELAAAHARIAELEDLLDNWRRVTEAYPERTWVAANARAERYREALDWVMQTVHRAHHDEPLESCPKSTCTYARSTLASAESTPEVDSKPSTVTLRAETIEECAKVAESDLAGVPGGIVPAPQRWDGGVSERTAVRIATAIRALAAPAMDDPAQQKLGNALYVEPKFSPTPKQDWIHILHEGLPLCGFSREVPGHWPEGHRWVRVEDAKDATCGGCLAKLQCCNAIIRPDSPLCGLPYGHKGPHKPPTTGARDSLPPGRVDTNSAQTREGAEPKCRCVGLGSNPLCPVHSEPKGAEPRDCVCDYAEGHDFPAPVRIRNQFCPVHGEPKRGPEGDSK